MTQTERQTFYQQMRWLILQSPDMALFYNEGYAHATAMQRATASRPLRRWQLKHAMTPRELAYRLGWNDAIDNAAHNTLTCATCGTVYSATAALHRCPVF